MLKASDLTQQGQSRAPWPTDQARGNVDSQSGSGDDHVGSHQSCDLGSDHRYIEAVRHVTDAKGTAGKTLVKTILERSADTATAVPTLTELLDESGLTSLPSDALDDLCKAAIEKLPREAESVRKGKVKVLMRLVGEVMRQSKGRADAVKTKAILENMLLK